MRHKDESGQRDHDSRLVSICLREEESFTTGRDVGEALVLASFPLAVADVEVDVDRSGESLVPIRRDLNKEGILQQRKANALKSCPALSV